MRKFTDPFDSYQLSVERPMIVELSPQRGHYNHLIENPLYYFNAFQYTHGELYRAIFGYEQLWDKNYEKDLMMALDFMMCFWAKKRDYYIEEIFIDRRVYLEALPWLRGVKPRSLNLMQRKRFKVNCNRATARVNALDRPFHVDVQLYTGEIFTVPYAIYMNLKGRRMIRSLDHENPSREAKGHAKNDANPTAQRLESLGRIVALKAVHDRLPNLRQRLRRQGSL